MSSDYFDFKQFRVYHNKCAMKVGTDSVLLGALAELNGDENFILDIGTGCGILALMLAQKSTSAVVAIEPDSNAAEQAKGNFEKSPWAGSLSLLNISLQDYAKNNPPQFDCIISNPPYFVSGKNILINNHQRSMARHSSSLSFEELIQCVNLLLTAGGKFWMILPVNEAHIFNRLALSNGLNLHDEIYLYPDSEKPANRVIRAYGKAEAERKQREFYIRNKSGTYTEEYVEITSAFLL